MAFTRYRGPAKEESWRMRARSVVLRGKTNDYGDIQDLDDCTEQSDKKGVLMKGLVTQRNDPRIIADKGRKGTAAVVTGRTSNTFDETMVGAKNVGYLSAIAGTEATIRHLIGEAFIEFVQQDL